MSFDPDKNDRLCRIIAAELRVDLDRVTPGARLNEDLAADHIDIVGLVVDIEDTFEVELTDDQIETVTTVHDLLVLIGAAPPTAAAAPAKAA